MPVISRDACRAKIKHPPPPSASLRLPLSSTPALPFNYIHHTFIPFFSQHPPFVPLACCYYPRSSLLPAFCARASPSSPSFGFLPASGSLLPPALCRLASSLLLCYANCDCSLHSIQPHPRTRRYNLGTIDLCRGTIEIPLAFERKFLGSRHCEILSSNLHVSPRRQRFLTTPYSSARLVLCILLDMSANQHIGESATTIEVFLGFSSCPCYLDLDILYFAFR